MRRYPSAKELTKLTKRGRYLAGPNLFLQVSQWGTRAWIFRYRFEGRPRHMGLGAAALLSLAEARDKAHELRRQLKIDGIDPLQAKKERAAAAKSARLRTVTFKEAAERYIAERSRGWRGDGSRKQWESSLNRYALPTIGDTPVSAIGKAEVTAILEACAAVPETQSRVKHRIAIILDFAHDRGWRDTAENPAKGRKLLTPRPKKEHFKALKYEDLPDFVVRLRRDGGQWAQALELLVLCASRPGEVLGMRWGELDLNTATWVVPGSRMKGGKDHRIPLSPRAVEILRQIPATGELVFPGDRGSKPWAQSLARQLRRMGHDETAHGMRSAFKSWASERTNYPHELVEVALAHTLGSLDEAYRRSDMMERRRRLMTDWSEYCGRPSVEADVMPMRGRTQ
jgi:integrase